MKSVNEGGKTNKYYFEIECEAGNDPNACVLIGVSKKIRFDNEFEDFNNYYSLYCNSGHL